MIGTHLFFLSFRSPIEQTLGAQLQDKIFTVRLHERYLTGVSPTVAKKLGLRPNFVKVPLLMQLWLATSAVFKKSHKKFRMNYTDSTTRREIARNMVKRLGVPNVLTLGMKWKANLKK